MNKTKTASLDLDRVGYWTYISALDSILYNKMIDEKIKNGSDMAFYIKKEETNILEIYIGGDSPLLFKGEDANDIYTLLIAQKEVI